MSAPNPDYANELPDSEALVNAHAEALIGVLPSIATFLQARVTLEREFAKKLSEQAATARASAVKHMAARGSSERKLTTLEEAFRNVIETADREAREHLIYADSLQRRVVDILAASGTQKEGIRKKHHAFAAKLMSERDKSYATRDKSKSKYFDACAALSSSRSRLTLVTAKEEGRQVEKAHKAYDQATLEMEIAKNQFLLDNDLANVAKSRLYGEDLPAVMGDFQTLESSAISHAAHLLSTSLVLAKDIFFKLMSGVTDSLSVVGDVDAGVDQRMFVEASGGRGLRERFELPRDLTWEESSVWHDTPEFSTSNAATIYLQNLSHQSLASLTALTPQISSTRKEVTGLRNLLEAYEKDRSLGDAGDVLEQLLEGCRNAVMLEVAASEARARGEIIGATLGDSNQGPQKLHDLKSSSFVTPVTCFVCDASVWGRGLLCKNCGCAVHVKCELHMPADCGLPKADKLARKASVASSVSARSPEAASARRSVPPPAILTGTPFPAASPASPLTPDSPSARARAPPRPSLNRLGSTQGTLLFEYAATSAFEISVTEGDVVKITEDEDESGWIKVRTQDDREGLIPASYLRLSPSSSSATRAPAPPTPTTQVPTSVESEPVGEQMTAIFDYVGEGEDELSFKEGDQFTVFGAENAEGWSEVEFKGVRGIVPSAYLRALN